MPRVFTDAGGQSLATASQTRLMLDTFSVSFWLKRTGTPVAAADLLASVGPQDGWFLELLTTNVIQAVISNATTDKVRNSTTAPALNAWVHVLVTHLQTGTASTDFLFYFDGKQEAGTNVSASAGAHTQAANLFSIGQNALAANRAPPAQIGQVALWSRAISPAEALALATGMHPLRFKEGLVEVFDLDGASYEEGYLLKLPLIQGATNPVNTGTVKPPVEVAIPALYETRQNTQPRSNWRSRYIANAVAGGAVINDHNFRRVARGAGLGVVRGAA